MYHTFGTVIYNTFDFNNYANGEGVSVKEINQYFDEFLNLLKSAVSINPRLDDDSILASLINKICNDIIEICYNKNIYDPDYDSVNTIVSEFVSVEFTLETNVKSLVLSLIREQDVSLSYMQMALHDNNAKIALEDEMNLKLKYICDIELGPAENGHFGNMDDAVCEITDAYLEIFNYYLNINLIERRLL